VPVGTQNVCTPGSCSFLSANPSASQLLRWPTRRRGLSGRSSPKTRTTAKQQHKRSRRNKNCKTNVMMARVVIRKPEIPCFVLNSQVRVADWEQVYGTHQGQRQYRKPRSKAGHRTVLTNRAINAFFPCKADAIHTGQTGLVRVPRMQCRKVWRGPRRLFGSAVHFTGPVVQVGQ